VGPLLIMVGLAHHGKLSHIFSDVRRPTTSDPWHKIRAICLSITTVDMVIKKETTDILNSLERVNFDPYRMMNFPILYAYLVHTKN
jgi:hypothetical protein